MKRGEAVKLLKVLPTRGRTLNLMVALGAAYSLRKWLHVHTQPEERKGLGNAMSELRRAGWPLEEAWVREKRKAVLCLAVGPNGVEPSGSPPEPGWKVYRWNPEEFRDLRKWAAQSKAKVAKDSPIRAAILKGLGVLR